MGIGRPLGRLATRLSKEESGWLIVEIMIGAVVLIVAGIAIYNGLDAASKTSGRNRNRTVASYLAQQDQERMRTMDAAALSGGYTNTRTVTIAGVNYRVDSLATAISDSTGSVSCTNNSNTAKYLKITSTVYDPSNKNAPVVQDSLLSPKPDDGNAAVQIVDRTGTNGVSGVPITLQEPPGDTVTTDTNGCSLFTFLDNGTQYHVHFAVSGYVDVNGNNSITGPITVVPGNVSTTQFQYDRAGSIQANFPAGDACVGLSFANTHLKLTPPVRNGTDFPQSNCTNSGSGTSNTATGLFPFTDAYAVYAGVCPANDPTHWGQAATFAPILTAGGFQTVTVNEPNVTVRVQRRTGSGTSNYQGADVKFTSTDCSANNTPQLVGPTTNSSGQSTYGIPYGAYTVCVDDNQGSNSHFATGTFNNDTSAGKSIPSSTTSYVIDSTTNSTKGQC
jgi:hypothetical protein